MKSAVHDCKEELKEVKLRATPARLGVLDVLEHADRPVDVSTIIQLLTKQKLTVDDVTVFRILHAFTAKGLAKAIQFNEGKFRYEYGANPEHHHFVCEKCGDIDVVENCNVDPIVASIVKKTGAQVTRHSLEFFGFCRDCKGAVV